MDIPTIGTWWPLALILLGWLVYLYATWDFDYWKKRGIPYIKPLPFFGNFKETVLFQKCVGLLHEEIYKKFEGYKYCGVFAFGTPALFIRDPEIVKDILVKEFSNFHDNEISFNPDVDPLIGRNPFVLKGERWKVTRTRLMPAFTPAKLKPLFTLINDVCKNLRQLIMSESSGEFEIKELCSRFTTDVVATCAYGVEGHALKDPESEFRQMGRSLISPDFISNVKLMLFFLAPSITKFFKMRFIPIKVEKFFVRLVADVVKQREEKSISRNDYIQHLMGVKSKTDTEASKKYPFTDLDVAAAAMTFFLDGFETSAGAMTLNLYCLALNPDVQSKLREEVITVLNENGGELTYENLQKMTYLDMVFAETLRLYPLVMFLKKICLKPTKIELPTGGGELAIEEGTPAFIPVYALHRDPEYYPDPEAYIPERFTEENIKSRPKYAYLPFGDGPRICLGMRFAQLQVKAGIASLLLNFEIKPTDRTPIPLTPDPASILLNSKEPLWLKFVSLNSNKTNN